MECKSNSFLAELTLFIVEINMSIWSIIKKLYMMAPHLLYHRINPSPHLLIFLMYSMVLYDYCSWFFGFSLTLRVPSVQVYADQFICEDLRVYICEDLRVYIWVNLRVYIWVDLREMYLLFHSVQHNATPCNSQTYNLVNLQKKHRITRHGAKPLNH